MNYSIATGEMFALVCHWKFYLFYPVLYFCYLGLRLVTRFFGWHIGLDLREAQSRDVDQWLDCRHQQPSRCLWWWIPDHDHLITPAWQRGDSAWFNITWVTWLCMAGVLETRAHGSSERRGCFDQIDRPAGFVLLLAGVASRFKSKK